MLNLEDPWARPRFTCDYSQPEEYRFSLDSILLAKAAAHDLKISCPSEAMTVLDLCAGAGVVGLEFSFLFDDIARMDFVEVQAAYRPHFETNLARTPMARRPTRWREINYAGLLAEESAQYDLVLANPPYFEASQGKIPPAELKARSRFFLDSDFDTLWAAILHVLKPGGRAYVLVRPLGDHGQDRLAALQKKIGPHGEPIRLGSLRGTDLIKLTKH